MGDNPQFSDSQALYLEGLARGLSISKGLKRGGDRGVGPDAPMIDGQDGNVKLGRKLVPEEKMKRDRHPLDRWSEITARASAKSFPKGTDVLVTKFFGMFYVAPAQDSYMCRLRLPNGVITSSQLQGVASLARRYAAPYADITTRANLQLREIGVADPVHVLNGLYGLGIINKGSGADNVRNITGSPLAGVDPVEIIDTREIAAALHWHILNTRELFGLPRKFNIALDGGGRAAVLAETNDLAFQAVRGTDTAGHDTVRFHLGLGGITGHGDFAQASGYLVRPEEVVQVSDTVLRIFIEHGNRSDRSKARLKYLLDEWGHERFIAEIMRRLPDVLRPASDFELAPPATVDRYAHMGVHPQKQPGLFYLGVGLPVGRLTCSQMLGIAEIARQFGSGQVRLTVWQNLLITDLASDQLEAAKQAIESLGLETSPHAVRSNLVACTGSAGCKFAASDTKRDALRIAEHIDRSVALDTPINIHLTGCHHSCAQHYIGDIGLIARKVLRGDEDIEAYDLVLGGDYGSNAKIASAFCSGITVDELPGIVEKTLQCYLNGRAHETESFNQFVSRVSPETLKSRVLTDAAATVQ